MSDPLLNAARKVEIKNAQTTMDDPNHGFKRREPSNWNPMLKIPRTKESRIKGIDGSFLNVRKSSRVFIADLYFRRHAKGVRWPIL